MLLGGECYKCVIDGATCDAQAAERVRQFPVRGPLSTSGAAKRAFSSRAASAGASRASPGSLVRTE